MSVESMMQKGGASYLKAQDIPKDSMLAINLRGETQRMRSLLSLNCPAVGCHQGSNRNLGFAIAPRPAFSSEMHGVAPNCLFNLHF